MQKPAGVLVAASLLSLLTVLGALSAIGSAVVLAVTPHLGATPQPPVLIVGVVLAIVLGVPTIFTACVALGLFRGKNWARISGIVLGCLIVLAALFFLLTTTAMMLMPHTRIQFAGNARLGLIASDIFYLALAAFGVWLAIYLNLQQVKQAFHAKTIYVPSPAAYSSAAYDPAASSPLPAAAYVAIPSTAIVGSSQGLSVSRIVVLVMALLNILGSLSSFGMAAAEMPLFYLGVTLHGHAATITLLFLGALNIGIAIGLLRRFPTAYYAALGLQVFGIASSLALLSPSLRARTIEYSMAFAAHMSPQQPPQMQAQMQSMMHSVQNGALLLGAVLVPFVSAFFILALWRDLAEIRKSAPATR